MGLFGWDWSAIGAWVLQFGGIVLAPVFGVVGTVVGARIGVRDARARWVTERQDARIASERAIALEVAESGYEWMRAAVNQGMLLLDGQDNGLGNAEILRALATAETRHSIAFAAFYATVLVPESLRAARALDALRPPLADFANEDIAGISKKEPAAIERARKRLWSAYGEYRVGIAAYLDAVTSLIAPRD
jgi:hypothetical protein